MGRGRKQPTGRTRYTRSGAFEALYSGPQEEVEARFSKLNHRVLAYFQSTDHSPKARWLSRTEIPTSEELMDVDDSVYSSEGCVEIEANRPEGAWDTKELYLSTQYELLREQACSPLREAIQTMKDYPHSVEDDFQGEIGLYDRVRTVGLKTSTRGVAVRIAFSLNRVKKQILWEQSKRLITGSMVALIRVDDIVKGKVIVATIAARPLDHLQQRNPPELYVFFARPDDIEIDPDIEYLMIEARSSYFEADRHTLTALQHMSNELTPLLEHLTEVKPDVGPPQYVQQAPQLNLSPIFEQAGGKTVNVLADWPSKEPPGLDSSQFAALHHMLTKKLAIIQGPPGTGKTYVSVQTIAVLLANWEKGDPPIILISQTNHAIDQLVRHVLPLAPDLVRIGGQSHDEIVETRTLFEVRNEDNIKPPPGCELGPAGRNMRQMESKFKSILEPLRESRYPIDPQTLQEMGILSEVQVDSLIKGASEWGNGCGASDGLLSPFSTWLGDAIVPVSATLNVDMHDYPFEDADLDFEELKETEQEAAAAKDDDDIEKLRGPDDFELRDNFTCPKASSTRMISCATLLKKQDLWDIEEAHRGEVYRYLQVRMKECIRDRVRSVAKQYDGEAFKRKIGRWQTDENILRDRKVIAMTATGFSKYRGLIAALSPRIIMCEEAAEILEPPVTVTCLPSLQHLILVGDHAQLRPHTECRRLDDKPFFFNVSLFERMVNNQIEVATLRVQRRMAPEIRELLFPIYADKLLDHPSVCKSENRPDVPGMGGKNSWWFSHEWADSRDNLMSSCNIRECEMIAGFVKYLVMNGTQPKRITCLTFYNGQRKALVKELRNANGSTDIKEIPYVVTVDSYQGEENDIVILSLVRSNTGAQIGFSGNQNRVCVALSRARRGLYIFGNGKTFYDYKGSLIWKSVVKILGEKKRVAKYIPLRCSTHHNLTEVKSEEEMVQLQGGCREKCGVTLPCGHRCAMICHTSPHRSDHCKPCVRPSAGKPGDQSAAHEAVRSSTPPVQASSNLVPTIGLKQLTLVHEVKTQTKPLSPSPKSQFPDASSLARQDSLIDLNQSLGQCVINGQQKSPDTTDWSRQTSLLDM